MKTYRIIQIVSVIISAITGIAACFAAVAAFLTVRQMAEQRRASYQPELIVARSSFTSGAKDAIDPFSFLDWREDNTQAAENASHERPYSIRLANVGLGGELVPGASTKDDAIVKLGPPNSISDVRGQTLLQWIDYHNPAIHVAILFGADGRMIEVQHVFTQ